MMQRPDRNTERIHMQTHTRARAQTEFDLDKRTLAHKHSPVQISCFRPRFATDFTILARKSQHGMTPPYLNCTGVSLSEVCAGSTNTEQVGLLEQNGLNIRRCFASVALIHRLKLRIIIMHD
jgi:hypothetical protein